jgi:release factor glutamine methyltransferase
MQNIIYEPGEDSTLLRHYVKQYAKGSVLDIGTGSAIQAIAAAKSGKVRNVIATDIQDSIIRHNKKNIRNKKIKFLKSDLFGNIKNKKFDTIIFNPPYLPSELKLKDLTTEGGKKGYEVIEKFLNQANNFLKNDGIILIVFSSLTKKDRIDEFIRRNLLESKLLDKRHIFFEDLYIYMINKSLILNKLGKKGIKNIRYFAKGKRGFVFTGNYKNKKVAVKVKRPESKAIGRINNEVKFLKILNKKGIGPKLLFCDKDFLAYEFVEGINISEFLEKTTKKTAIKIIKNVFQQLFTMDKLKINKEEMSHPVKHILIKKNRPVLIDFERAHYALKPGNVTQFCDFLISMYVLAILKNNNIKLNKNKIVNAAKQYKKQQNKDNFNKIIALIR